MQIPRFSFLLLAVVLVSDGCGGDDGVVKSSLGESCTMTADCESSLRCILQVCLQAGTDCPGAKNCGGRECGPDPVCEEPCGSCGLDKSCKGGQCVGIGSWDTYSSTVDTTTPLDTTVPLDTTEPPIGIWVDPYSGLQWQVTPTGGTRQWTYAKAHCTEFLLDGGGWRVPSISEYRTLIRGCSATETDGSCNIDFDCLASSCWYYPCDGCLYLEGPAGGCYWPPEIQGECSYYWSSSLVPESGGWSVFFMYAAIIEKDDITTNMHVRCVR